MRTGLWIMAAIGLGGVVFLAWVSQSTLRAVSGVDEARDLRELLQSSQGRILAPGSSLGVFRVPRSEAWPAGWRWELEATLAAGKGPDSPETARALARMVSRALSTRVMASPPSGVMLVLHMAGGETRTLLFDGLGARVTSAPAAAPGPPGGGTPR